MLSPAKRLALGFVLILLLSGMIVGMEAWNRRRTSDRPRVFLLKHVASKVLDDGEHGILDGLKEKGFEDGKTVDVIRKEAGGSVSESNAIAAAMVGNKPDLLISVSTLSLQAVAAANRNEHIKHVFGIVADPYVAKVGLDRERPDDRPPWMTGYSTFLPVKSCFEMARKLNPGLRRVGVAWNPGEANSEAFVKAARVVCKEMNPPIELVEADASSVAAVPDALNFLISHDVEAIWAGGDLVISQTMDQVIAAARNAHVPVISIVPGKQDRGTLFDLGLDFYEAGRLTGHLAAEVLNGISPAELPPADLMDKVPALLIVNRKALKDLEGKGGWYMPQKVLDEANVVIEEDGTVTKKK